MQGGQGRGGGARQGYNGRGNGALNHLVTGVTYGGIPGYVFNNWVGYNNYQMQGLMPLPAVVPRSYGRGSGSSSFVPLGVQGAGILKRPSGPPGQGQSVRSRSHGRRHGRRSRGSRGSGGNGGGGSGGQKNLTKEQLDADLDEWRMKDKKLGGSSLDADLDDYWKKKDEIDDHEEDEKDTKSKVGEGSVAGEDGVKDDKAAAGGSSSRHRSGDKKSSDGSRPVVLIRDP